MFRYDNGQFRVTPPGSVVYNGYRRAFAELTREERDEIGINEAIPVQREPFTTYATRWVKGEDLLYREEIVTAAVDEAAKAESLAQAVRADRDARLASTDWTQLLDCPLDDLDMVLWQSYRQALRDVPQQAGFPNEVEWPEEPAQE